MDIQEEDRVAKPADLPSGELPSVHYDGAPPLSANTDGTPCAVERPLRTRAWSTCR